MTLSDNLLCDIKKGKRNAVTLDVLAKKYGVRKNRIQEEIVELRKQGHAICASEKGDCRGYFIPLTYSESIDYMRATESRAKNIFNNLRAMHKALNDLFPCGQTTIDGII